MKNKPLIETIKEFVRRARASKYGWSGDYSNWEQAVQHSSGYDAANIPEKVKSAALKIRNGQAAYERDSVLFDQIEYSWPLLSGLLWAAAQNKGKLHVADFGGSFGSSYYQNKKFLDRLEPVAWSIVEQAGFVACGRESFQDSVLRFYYTVEECMKERGVPDILVLSCVLPYLGDPYVILKEMLAWQIPHILIDYTFFNYEDRDRISIQKVPPEIFEASIPCWFLDYSKVKACLQPAYEIVSEHTNDTNILLDGKKIPYRGLLLKRK
jgi:putative methyltransferase (TIGR04325 family)